MASPSLENKSSTPTTPTTTPATGGRRPRALNVVREPSAELLEPVDWSRWYLDEDDDVGEGCPQSVIVGLLLSVLKVLLRERGNPPGFLGHDNFFAWRQDQPRVRVAPDVYFIEGEVPEPLPSMWQTWREGHRPPVVAFEIVSTDWQKDYEEGPEKYAHLGVEELVIFDPDAAAAATRIDERVPLQIYRRHADDSFVREPLDARYLKSLDIYLVIDTSGTQPRLRLARDEAGSELVSSLEEAVEQEARRAEQQAQRAEQEAQRARESERALEAARAEIEALRAQLAARED